MRVGLFGGTFDPPHRGHFAVGRAAAERCMLDRVLLAPAARHPLKEVGPLAPFPDRLAMAALLCETDADGRLEPSSIDGPQQDGKPNYTVDTLQRLRARLAGDDTVFVITGADAFQDLRRWKSPDRLLELAEWIVVSRAGHVAEQLDHLGFTAVQRARVHWLGGVAEPVSATEVRARLASGLNCRDLVPDPVLAYIREHGLYTTPTR